MTRRPNFCPLYFPPNEVRLCMHLEIKDLPSGLPTRMKTHLQLFQRIRKNSAKLLRNCDAFLSGLSPGGVLLTERIHSSASYSFLASSKVDSTWLSLAQGNKNRKRKRKQPTYKEPRKNKFNNQQDTNTKATMDQPKSTTDQRKQQTSSKQQLSTQTSTRIQQTPNSKSTKSQQTWQTPKNKQTNKTTNQTATNNQQSNQ